MTFSAVKDPQAVIDYEIDWATILNATSPVDTISTSTWSVSDGLILDSESETTTTTTAWVSAGRSGAYANLTNNIVTVGGRTYDRTIVVEIRSR